MLKKRLENRVLIDRKTETRILQLLLKRYFQKLYLDKGEVRKVCSAFHLNKYQANSLILRWQRAKIMLLRNERIYFNLHPLFLSFLNPAQKVVENVESNKISNWRGE